MNKIINVKISKKDAAIDDIVTDHAKQHDKWEIERANTGKGIFIKLKKEEIV